MKEMIALVDTSALVERIESLIEESRKHVVAQVNSAMVQTYFEIGRMIVEKEQEGSSRAEYGKGLLKDLSNRLTKRFGRGFSVDNLENMRRFYQTYCNAISETVSRKSLVEKSENQRMKNRQHCCGILTGLNSAGRIICF